MPSANFAALRLTTCVEQGVLFETGRPVSFVSVRNTEKAPRLIRGRPDLFQQLLEPAGRYLLVAADANAPCFPPWQKGPMFFESPLVLEHGEAYDEQSWKARLARFFRARNRTLTAKLRRAGFDGIVTVLRSGETSECVDLRI